MSVVGPRPHAVAHNEEYRKLISGTLINSKTVIEVHSDVANQKCLFNQCAGLPREVYAFQSARNDGHTELISASLGGFAPDRQGKAKTVFPDVAVVLIKSVSINMIETK